MIKAENMKEIIERELKESAEILDKFLNAPDTVANIQKAADIMINAINNGGKIFAIGNGGSACDAMHFAEEMTGRFRESRDPLPALALLDPAHITCTGNDFGYNYIFSRSIRALGNKGDVLLAISTSGNSENILRATELCRQKDIRTVALSGKNGGQLAEFADVMINVPHQGYSDRIQEIHIKVIHILIHLIEEAVSNK